MEKREFIKLGLAATPFLPVALLSCRPGEKTGYTPPLTPNHTEGFNFAEFTRIEADYIASCQYLKEDRVYGAINNVYGLPTWVVPRENGLAILGLMEASRHLKDSTYKDRAELAADYLTRIQDPVDGGWYNHYSYDSPFADPKNEESLAKSPTQTAEVMIALHKLGFNANRIQAMKKGAEFLLACQDVKNKGGIDDGLVGAGKDPQGKFRSWRWGSDNAFSYQAFRAARLWADQTGESVFADRYATASERIIEGINEILQIPRTNPEEPVWLRVVDEKGKPPKQPPFDRGTYDWINYAPQLLDVPANEVGSPEVGAWIHSTFQTADGACVENNKTSSRRKFPGLTFQAVLVWLKLQQTDFAFKARVWALYDSGLWQKEPDQNGVRGGWVDWRENGNSAPRWQRFIDTSFYAIAAYNGGYNFNIAS